jgi:hypothetical protein
MLDKHGLKFLYRLLEAYYIRYKEGKISEKEYLAYIKPIDKAINIIELSTLQDNPAQKESFLSQPQKLEN